MTTLRRKTNLNARLRPSQRRFLASIAGRGMNDYTATDYAAAEAVGMRLPRWEVTPGKPLAACASYSEVVRAW